MNEKLVVFIKARIDKALEQFKVCPDRDLPYLSGKKEAYQEILSAISSFEKQQADYQEYLSSPLDPRD